MTEQEARYNAERIVPALEKDVLVEDPRSVRPEEVSYGWRFDMPSGVWYRVVEPLGDPPVNSSRGRSG